MVRLVPQPGTDPQNRPCLIMAPPSGMVAEPAFSPRIFEAAMARRHSTGMRQPRPLPATKHAQTPRPWRCPICLLRGSPVALGGSTFPEAGPRDAATTSGVRCPAPSRAAIRLSAGVEPEPGAGTHPSAVRASQGACEDGGATARLPQLPHLAGRLVMRQARDLSMRAVQVLVPCMCHHAGRR